MSMNITLKNFEYTVSIISTYCVTDECCALKLSGGPIDASLFRYTLLETDPGSDPGDSGAR